MTHLAPIPRTWRRGGAQTLANAPPSDAHIAPFYLAILSPLGRASILRPQFSGRSRLVCD